VFGITWRGIFIAEKMIGDKIVKLGRSRAIGGIFHNRIPFFLCFNLSSWAST
jgi:hypothetical protein